MQIGEFELIPRSDGPQYDLRLPRNIGPYKKGDKLTGTWGYKGFESDFSCRGMTYRVGDCYEMNELPILCLQGFHFCKDPNDVLYYYFPFEKDLDCFFKFNVLPEWSKNFQDKQFKCRYAYVFAYGNISCQDVTGQTDFLSSKKSTNKILILDEIPTEDFIKKVWISHYLAKYQYEQTHF